MTSTADDGTGGLTLREALVAAEASAGNDAIIFDDALRNQTITLQAPLVIGDTDGDTVRGGDGNDTMNGGSDDGSLVGGTGRDSLSGNGWDDTLRSADGNDTLTGGGGKDVLTGGNNADTFQFLSASESAAGIQNRDVITDFASADVIDLSAIDAQTDGGNQAFVFIGQDAFSGTKGELHYLRQTAQDRTIIQGDRDGDGTADFEIELSGAMTLQTDDFIL